MTQVRIAKLEANPQRKAALDRARNRITNWIQKEQAVMSTQEICNVATCKYQVCIDAQTCYGVEWRENHAPAYLRARAQQLVEEAAYWGYVLTIERVPTKPLAMGNHVPVIDVRKTLANIRADI
jgi:hypothetical protein